MAKPRKDGDEGDEPVGPKRRQSSEVILAPSVLALTSWTVDEDERRPLALVVPGRTHFDRQTVLKQYRDGDWKRFHSGIVLDVDAPRSTEWLGGNLATGFLGRVQVMPMPPAPKNIMAAWYPHAGTWELLWSLIAVEEFVVEESLRQIIDKPFYLVHDIHRALWEARFLAREHATLQPVEDFMVHFTRWLMCEPLGDEGRRVLSALGITRTIANHIERFDVACFLLSLACQNGLLERAVFLFDDLEDALQPNKRSMLRQLRDLLDSARRWGRLGSNPLGVLIGFTGSRTDLQLLTKYCSSLAEDVHVGLAWARRTLSS